MSKGSLAYICLLEKKAGSQLADQPGKQQQSADLSLVKC